MVALFSHLSALLHVVGRRFADKTKGATAVEYGIMVALIAVVIIAAVALIGTNLDAMFDAVGLKIPQTIPA
ncbi:Flp family type IVb pilin [Tessaracoccus sp. Z1128]